MTKFKEIYDEMFGNKKAYHCVMPKSMGIEDAMKSVIQKGLIPNNNGERGNGIWFSVDDKFYNDAAFVVSLELSQENIDKFDIMDSDSSIAFAKKPIPFDKLEVEKIPIMCFNGRFSCYEPNNSNDYFEKTYVDRGKDFVDMLNRNGYHNIIVYRDIIEMFCSKEFCDRIRWDDIVNPNVKVINLLKH